MKEKFNTFISFLHTKLKSINLESFLKKIKTVNRQFLLVSLFIILSIFLVISIIYLLISGTMFWLLLTMSSFILLTILIVFYSYKRKMQIFMVKMKGLDNEYSILSKKYFDNYGKKIKSLPSYLMIGKEESGKNLFFSDYEYPFRKKEKINDSNINYFYNEKMLAWDVDGSVEVIEDRRSEWENGIEKLIEFFKLKKHFPVFDGVIVFLPIDDINVKNKADLDIHSEYILEKLEILFRKITHSMPVYIMITKCDRICGFKECFRYLDKSQLKNEFGWLNSIENFGKKFDEESFKIKMLKIISRIKSDRFRIINKIYDNSTINNNHEFNEIYSVSENLKNLIDNIIDFSKRITNENIKRRKKSRYLGAAPLFIRGIFFSSSKQDKNYIDNVSRCFDDKYPEFCSTVEKDSQIAMFKKDIFKKYLFMEKSLVIYMISSSGLYKVRKLLSWGTILLSFAVIFLFTGAYWFNIVDMIKMEGNNFSYIDPDYKDAKDLYPEKTLEFLRLKREHYFFEYIFAEIIKVIDDSENQSKLRKEIAYQKITMPYTSLINYKTKLKFEPEYLNFVAEMIEKNEERFKKSKHILDVGRVMQIHDEAIEHFCFYVNDYYNYWNSMLENLSPVVSNWNNLGKKSGYEWEIRADFSKNLNIIKNALEDYESVLLNSKAVSKSLNNRKQKLSKVRDILNNIKNTEATLDNNDFYKKTGEYMYFWQKMFLIKNPVTVRNDFYTMSSSDFINKVVYINDKSNKNIDYYKRYWQQLTKAFLTSFKDEMRDAAEKYYDQLQEKISFPVGHLTGQNKILTDKEIDEIYNKINTFWPSEKIFADASLGSGAELGDTDLNKIIVDLRPSLSKSKMKWINTVKDVIAIIRSGVYAKVYLVGTDEFIKQNNASGEWNYLCMEQDDSKNQPVYTRDEDNLYLGKLTAKAKDVKFYFYRSEEAADEGKYDEAFTLNGKWSLLKLLFKGTERPQAFNGDCWISWNFVKRIDRKNFITRLTFTNSSQKERAFYLKLKFSKNIEAILEV